MKKFLVEVRCNDGTFLNEIVNLSKAKVLGVDPSSNITKIAKEKIQTLTSYFDYKPKIIKKIWQW